ncbi:unnamed protein product [Danaus chrysippus]|uniref:Odorant receptor n=1 Tax=Danaus chrysippus TaxID=151541 RepID=A0A8J2QG26_9NEOP|nr:unnamed protein product [Danaus chrysippus]
MVYYSAAFSSIFGVTISAEKNQLPLRAWYPFDATKRPVYQWTYAHQIIALSIAAGVNLCCDVLASALIGQCRCRMRLIADSLRTLCDDVEVDKKGRVTAEGEKVLKNRVRSIAMRHQLVLEQVKQLQQCFSIPILVQFAVAAFIICVTAYRMAFENSFYRLMSMIIYIIVITMQVYIYCVEGNNLTIDSYEISRAAYECPWYECSVPLRRLLLVIMIRCTRPTIITAGGIVELSLDTFVCDHETRNQQVIFLLMTFVTTIGWATITDKNGLPLPAWYPYNTSISPAYELTYMHQTLSIMIVAVLNITSPIMIIKTSTLVGKLPAEWHGKKSSGDEDYKYYGGTANKLFTSKREAIVKNRQRIYVPQHQRALRAAEILQNAK